MVQLNEKNINIIPNLIYDKDTACIIKFEKIIDNHRLFMEKFIKHLMIHKSTSKIDYKALILDCCSQGHIIYRQTHQYSEGISFEFFYLKRKKEAILNSIKEALSIIDTSNNYGN